MVPLVHPWQLNYSDVQDHESGYANIVNCCQRHTRHGPQCIRKNKTTKQEECRFKFPFPLQDTNTCLTKESGSWEIKTERNDPLVNRHNRYITEHWRANTDVQCIVSLSAVLNYIAKYATKGEPRSKAIEELLNDALSKGDDKAVTAIQNLFIRTCSERDYSAQETFHIVMGWPLYHSSRSFVKVNVDNEQWMTIDQSNDDDRSSKSVLDTYPQRPQAQEDMSLIQLFSHFYKKGNRWVKRRTPAVIRVFPIRRLNSLDKVAYYQQQVLLHVSWRELSAFDDEDWASQNLSSTSGALGTSGCRR